ncbi:MAG: SafA/ExsA family spore coat assembly protein [Methanocella sp.]
MSITVQNRFLRVRDVIGEGRASAILQDTLDLSGQYPDVERVVAAHAVPRNLEAVPEDGRIMVRGALAVRLLYAALTPAPERMPERMEEEDPPVTPTRLVLVEFPEVCPFEVPVEVAGAAAHLRARASLVVESVNASLVNRRRLGLDVALVAGAEVEEDQEVRPAVEVTVLPPDRARVVRETVHVEHLATEGVARPRLELSLAIPQEEPAVSEVLWVVPRHHHLMGRTGEGKAFVEGLIDVDAVYLTGIPEAPVHAFTWPDAHRFAFTFDLPGIRPGMLLLPELVLGEPVVGLESERTLTVGLEAGLRAAVRHVLELPLVTDTVSETGQRLDVLRRAVRFPVSLTEGHLDRSVGGVLSLPPTKPPIERIIWTDAGFIAEPVVIQEDRVLIEGDLSLRLLYQAAGPETQIHTAEFPRALRLSHAVDMPGIRPGMMALPRCLIRAIACRLLDAETLQLDVAVHLAVRAARVVQAEVATEIVAVSPCPPGTTLRLVIVQPGDTLWLLSRRYGVSLDAIIRANPQIANPDLIYPGQRIRIPCAPLEISPVAVGDP